MKTQLALLVTPLFATARPLGQRLERWWQLHLERQQLASLSDDMLKDIGLSRADILEEVEKPFWDDPLDRSRSDLH